jgi:hypothetical protein
MHKLSRGNNQKVYCFTQLDETSQKSLVRKGVDVSTEKRVDVG